MMPTDEDSMNKFLTQALTEKYTKKYLGIFSKVDTNLLMSHHVELLLDYMALEQEYTRLTGPRSAI